MITFEQMALRLAEMNDKYKALREAVQTAIKHANGHELEWGERAEKCFTILERAIASCPVFPDYSHKPRLAHWECEDAFRDWHARPDIGYDINTAGYEKYCSALDGFHGGWNEALKAASKVIDDNPAVAKEKIEAMQSSHYN